MWRSATVRLFPRPAACSLSTDNRVFDIDSIHHPFENKGMVGRAPRHITQFKRPEFFPLVIDLFKP